MKSDKTPYQAAFAMSTIPLLFSAYCLYLRDSIMVIIFLMLSISYLLIAVKRRNEYKADERQELIDNLIEEK